MSISDDPGNEKQSRQDAMHAETREMLAHTIHRMETSIQWLHEIEHGGTPLTRDLLHERIEILKENLAKAEADFLQAEPEPVVREAYQILSELRKKNQQNNIAE
jgi:hypothetical protein